MVSLFRNVHSSNATFITCVAVDVGILAPEALSCDAFISQMIYKCLFHKGLTWCAMDLAFVYHYGTPLTSFAAIVANIVACNGEDNGSMDINGVELHGVSTYFP